MFWRTKSHILVSFTIPVGKADPAASTLEPRAAVARAKSANQVPSMATVTTMPTTPRTLAPVDSDYLNTLPDPRTPSPGPPSPNLVDEVSMLSTKLINAVNHSTTLEDALQHVRHDLEHAQRTIQELEAEKQQHTQSIADGVLLKKAEVDKTITELRKELDETRRERETSEKARKGLELEVENLTASLFEEANKMVADARRQNEVAEKRNAQLQSKLSDTETLLASQQEQLQDLKVMMEELSSEPDAFAQHGSVPSSPATDVNKISRMLDSLPLSPGHISTNDLQPHHPLHYSHLISPVLRQDLTAYNEFSELIKIPRAMSAITHQRTSSGSSRPQSSGAVASNPTASSSSPHLPGSFNTTKPTPNMTSPRNGDTQASSGPALKEARFFKRTLQEDIEPTLRLELAPGLSWLARRSVLTSIIQGGMVIEPFTSASKLYGPLYSCILCGEDRRQEAFARRHRFRTSDDINAQRHPLCDYCVNRLRATCHFVAFLRMCRDGTWKTGTDEDMKGAWEECVRLRERMFWARVGGGVVPAALAAAAAAQAGQAEKARRSGETSEATASADGATDAAAGPTDAAIVTNGDGSEKGTDNRNVVLVPATGPNTPAVRLGTPPPHHRKNAIPDTKGAEDASALTPSESEKEVFEDAASTPEPAVTPTPLEGK